MLKSMTGYGKASGEVNQRKIVVEIKSLNSKQVDINAKLNLRYRQKELEIRNELISRLNRGKIEIQVYPEQYEEENMATINTAVFKNYYKQLENISRDLNLQVSDQIISTITRMPEVLKIEREELPEEEWLGLKNILIEAIQNLVTFREQEGSCLEKDMRERIKIIRDKLHAIKPFEKDRIANVQNRIKNNLSEFLGSENIDKERFEQELIYYLEKMDITEEKVRLANHLDYFDDTVNGTETTSGKKLNFISQEIGREINTIGSKAADSNIQKLVVEMKDELEKIKEQLMNVL
jgi:uncharacterized protein (TIGR00255 family)